MKWYTRPVDQGQIVEVSYAYDGEGGAYKRVEDRGEAPGSSGRWTYYYGDLDWDREPEFADHDHAPCVEAWTPCEAPQVAS